MHWISALVLLLALACSPTERSPAPASDTPAAAPEPEEDLTQVDTVIAPALAVDLQRMNRRESGLYVLDVRRGAGTVADSGRWVDVHYTGWLSDGTKIDDSRERGEPHRFPLGYGRVLPAWDEGVRGMREGGSRRMVVPPALGYGRAGQPGRVPSRATLIFDLDLVRVH